MSKASVCRLKANDNVATKIHTSQKSFAGCYVITTNTKNIYTSSSDARKNAGKATPDSNAMYTIKTNVACKIVALDISGGQLSAQVNCGPKTGWIYVGKLKNKNPNGKASFAWEVGPYVGIGCPSEKYATGTLKLKSTDIQYKSKTLDSLTNGTGINKDVLIAGSGNSDNAASGDDDESDSSSTAASTSSSASSSGSSGEINVTYEYALKINPPYAYNIMDHLAGSNSEQNKEYLEQIKSSGVNYKTFRNVFGMPCQFLPTTDCRVSNGYSDNLEIAGYEFAEKIVSRMPLLYITPGNTSFMGGSSENARTALIGQLGVDGASSGDGATETSLETMLGEYNGKLYSLTPAYTEYFKYVNPMCRAGAIFLDIADSSLDGEGAVYGNSLLANGETFENMNWGVNEGLAYELWEEEEDTEEDGEETEEDEDKSSSEEEKSDKKDETDQEETEPKKAKFEEDYSEYFKKPDDSTLKNIQQALYYGNAISFYINSDSSFQDSFSNETSESSLSTTINALSDKAREIQFLLGTADSAVGEAFDKVDGTLSDIKDQINKIVEKISGGNTIFTTIANSVKTIVSGGRMLFPQIWSNSTFSKSYNISIKLTTPSTDRISWWLNIYVPLCHLMALVLPRSQYVNSYTTPFIIKAFYKGMFNIDMGIITEMTFNKGKEGSWTRDSLPTVVDVTFTIQDLYSAMGMTSTEKMFKGRTLQNVAEMDYIANLCGININEPDNFRMVNLWCAFNVANRVYDFIPNLSMGVDESIRNSITKAYTNFWM